MREKKYFYDTRIHSKEVIAGTFIEEGVTDLRLRIHKAEVYRESRIGSDNWEWNDHSGAEKKATENVFELAKKGNNLIIWISPDDGGKVYQEGRINVYLPSQNNDEWEVQGWGIPLQWDRFKSTELGIRLLDNGGVTMGTVDDPESLRRQPVGFELKKNKSWLDQCRELMPEFSQIWNLIQDGDEVKNKEKMIRDVEAAMVIARGDNRLFELTMKNLGHRINAEGGHGSSWLGSQGIYNFKIERIGGMFYAEKLKVNGKTICPICGVEINENRSVCPKCGLNLKDNYSLN